MSAEAVSRLTVAQWRSEGRRRSLHRFMRAAWPIVEPDTAFVDNWHLRVLCEQLERVSRGEITHVLINVPPGTAKSLVVSVFWPAWEWASRPALRYLTAAYGQDLATRDATKMRELVLSDWYQSQWPTPLRSDQNVKTHFDSIAGGWRQATSVGGRGTGLHPDRIIVDDPHTVGQVLAQSGVEREQAVQWFYQTLSSRGMTRPDRAIVVIMQRLHEEDLSGAILRHPDAVSWVHLCWPMRAEPASVLQPTAATRPPLDPRAPGELLWPALLPEDAVAALERRIGPWAAPGQLQQRPTKVGGAIFRRSTFGVLEAVPLDVVASVRFWDAASTPGGGDWTAGVKVGQRANGRYVVLDVIRVQESPDMVARLIAGTAVADGRAVRIREEQEGGSSGKAVISTRSRMLAGFDYLGRPATGPKASRWTPFAIQAGAGNVDVIAAPWTSAFFAELEAAPLGSHDDQLDAAAGAFFDVVQNTGVQVAGIRGR